MLADAVGVAVGAVRTGDIKKPAQPNGFDASIHRATAHRPEAAYRPSNGLASRRASAAPGVQLKSVRSTHPLIIGL
jgi:hypothetical protein